MIGKYISASLSIVLVCLSHMAPAAYPDKPIRLIVTFPAGGITDLLARIVGQKLTERLGQPVVIDNRGGMGGSIGTQAGAKAPADGHTLVFSAVGAFTLNTVLYKQIGYDPLKDFLPVIAVAAVPNLLVVPASAPYKNLNELIAAARAKPGSLTYAGTGFGAMTYLAAELLKLMAKVDITEISYKGAAPALIDVLAGHVGMLFDTPATSIAHIKSGRLRPLGVTSPKRVRAMPDVPTIAEQGYPGFDAVAWYGIWAPAGTPVEIVRKLNSEIDAILNLPDVAARMNEMGAETMGGSVESFTAFHRAEFQRWTTFAKESGIKPQ
ncbi:MAG TPA: tripartite tricarboxylate transporter substrate binding protein [Burkholderiales bacterium]|nr:tripartite tricarboxylate transporter substrate binding protein [Burkholderiales bacterium]